MAEERRSLRGMYAKEDGVIAEYMDELYLKRGLRKATAYNYYMCLRHWAKFLVKTNADLACEPEEVVLPALSAADVLRVEKKTFCSYLDYCLLTRQERRGYVNTRISVIRGFYRWLAGRESCEPPAFIEKAERLERSRVKTVYVTETMERKLYTFFQERQESELAARNRCIVYLMLHLPMTLKEIVELDLSDVNMESLRVRNTDTGAEREIATDDDAVAAINCYLAVRPQPRCDGNPFFVSNRLRGRMRPCTVEKMLRHAAKRALPGQYITLRDIQKTALRNMLNKKPADAVFGDSRIGTRRYFRRAYGTGAEAETQNNILGSANGEIH